MPRGARVLSALGLVLSASALAAQEYYPPPEQYRLRGEYQEWRPGLFSEFQKGSGGEPGTLLDAEDDLGIEDRRRFQVRGTLQFKQGHKLRGSWTPLDYDGDVQARRTFTYGATTYNRFSNVVSSLKGNYFTGEYEWDFMKGARGYLGGLIGAKVFDVDTVIVAPAEAKRETDTMRVPIPVIGVAGRVYTGRLSFEGEMAGISIGDRGNVYEIYFAAQVHLGDRLAVKGGYRRLKLHATDDPDEIDLRLGGWHFGLELSL